MHTFLLLLCGFIILSGVMLLICNINDDGMTPVRKVFESLFIALCAFVLTVQVAMDHPLLSRAPLAVISHAVSAPPIEQARVIEVEPDPAASVPPAVADRALVERQSVAPVERVVTTAPVQVAAPAPVADSGAKDMLLGGALGYLMGSAGNRGGGGDTHTVTHNTTVVHAAPPAPRPAYAGSASRPSYAPPAAAPTRSTFRSTFTNRVRR